MSPKSLKDVVTLSALKADPERVVRRVNETQRPVLLTNDGQVVAVIQSVQGYEKAEEEIKFLKDVFEGLADLEAGRVVSFEEVKRRLGMK